MKDAGDRWNLFTLDTGRNVWYREDGLQVTAFGTTGDELYAIDAANNTLLTMKGSMGELEEDFSWKAEFGLSGIEYANSELGRGRADVNGSHYMSRFDLRMYIEEGSRVELEIMYNSDGVWTKQGEIRGTSMKTFVLPVIPKRCDHLRFRLKGTGPFRIYSISRVMEVGSDG